MKILNENAVEVNLNDYIRVKLTDHGKDIYYHQNDALIEYYIKQNPSKKCPFRQIMPETDSEGYTKMLLWEFVQLYGNHIGMGFPNVIDPINIFVEKEIHNEDQR